MTDESGQTYPFTVDALLDQALGPEGYYGAFTANMHTDVAVLAQSDADRGLGEGARRAGVAARQLLTGSTAATARRSRG